MQLTMRAYHQQVISWSRKGIAYHACSRDDPVNRHMGSACARLGVLHGHGYRLRLGIPLPGMARAIALE